MPLLFTNDRTLMMAHLLPCWLVGLCSRFRSFVRYRRFFIPYPFVLFGFFLFFFLSNIPVDQRPMTLPIKTKKRKGKKNKEYQHTTAAAAAATGTVLIGMGTPCMDCFENKALCILTSMIMIMITIPEQLQ